MCFLLGTNWVLYHEDGILHSQRREDHKSHVHSMYLNCQLEANIVP
jgi:hypothetical protein